MKWLATMAMRAKKFARRSSVLTSSLVVLLALCAGQTRAEQCGLKRMASLPMTHEKDGGVTIAITIDGTERKFYLDPAEAHSALYDDVAAAMDLKTFRIDNFQLYMGRGTRITHYVYVPEIGIGSMKGTGGHFLDIKRTSEQKDVAGIIGTDILRNFDLDLDFDSMTLNLFSSDHCPGKVVYWSSDFVEIPCVTLYDGLVQIPVTLDGHDFRALLDVGDDLNYLEVATTSRVYGIDDRSPGTVPLPNAKPDDMAHFSYRFKLLSMVGVTVSNPSFALVHSDAEAAFERDEGALAHAIHGETSASLDLAIGFDTLSKLHIYIAYGEQKIYLTAARAGKPAPGAQN